MLFSCGKFLFFGIKIYALQYVRPAVENQPLQILHIIPTVLIIVNKNRKYSENDLFEKSVIIAREPYVQLVGTVLSSDIDVEILNHYIIHL